MTTVLDETAWQAEGECCKPHSNCTEDDFFYEGRFRPNSKEQRAHVQRLRDICAECLVFDDCRGYVDGKREANGFWAGETEDERRARWYEESVVRATPAPVTTKGAAKL